MPARVIFIGLDAAEATLVERLAAEGRLPAFARLAAEGSGARLGNSLESLPGAIWPELTMGRSGGKVGQFFHPRQLHTGETRLRQIEADEVDPASYYWSIASRHGRRVAVVDQPQAGLPRRSRPCTSGWTKQSESCSTPPGRTRRRSLF